jgi:hypothetical protein
MSIRRLPIALGIVASILTLSVRASISNIKSG